MKKLFTLLLVIIAIAGFAQQTGTAVTGVDDGMGGTRSLSGSYVAFDPSAGGELCYTPGVAQDFVFKAESFSPDWEYVYEIWLQFPSGWVVNNVSVVGTPVCNNGSWGTLSWSGVGTNTADIYHPRYQGNNGANCAANYMVNVTSPGAATGNAYVSWYWDGDAYGSIPHHPCSSDQYTPDDMSGEPCDEWVNPRAVIPICSNNIPCGWEDIATEPNSGRMDNVLVTYNNLIWSITGYGSASDVRYYNPGSDTWTSVAGSNFNINYARSGATYGSKAFVYGDAAGSFSGLWSYDMISNVWTNETPSGTPPGQTGIWAPAWVADPATGYLYITGGATAPGGGNLSTVYVYNPATNAWLAPLPNFTTARDFHAAFIFTHPATGHKMLAVAGGTNASAVVFTSTQCYDFVTGVWNAENADIPALPQGWWGMGYAHNVVGADHHLWLVGGADAGFAIIPGSAYYDVTAGTWVDGGVYHATPVYRTSAAVLNGEVYKISGSSGGFSPTGLSSKYVPCKVEPVPLSNWALFIGIGLILIAAVVRFRRLI